MNKRLFLLLFLYIPRLLLGKEGDEHGESKPLPIGNFSVGNSTQIAPLVSFGQLIIDKNVLFPVLYGIYAEGQSSHANRIRPGVVYGIQDNFSAYFVVPYDTSNRYGSSRSSGFEDVVLQMEYAYYSRNHSDSALQATIVGNVQFPTGSSSKNPPTGDGSCSYFLGATYAYTSYNWYAFGSAGIDLTTTHHGTKFGNSYLYQCGIARYIKQLSPHGCVFNLMVELDGTYFEKDKIHRVTNPNSGGNVIIATPSICLASKQWLVQWGIGFPILQNLNGEQYKVHYAIVYSLGVALQF